MRNFVLYIDKGIEWGVYQKGYYLWDDKDYDKKRANKYMFGGFCTKDSLIMGFFDISIDDDMIKTAKNDEIMQEICEFRVLINDTFKESFNGTFIDALNYIKRHFKPDEF
ncbi:hypothetical protein CCAL13119_09085 [Campylobacter sp. RM13119]|uniref:hypothetical protein n=1 Tax=Campylobacter californiensis TaxID=1032243 RepID=UPI0014744B4D|nr:hypothetical protein [Campylobacter sp. RM13119]MBE3607077.1 hypothetical protein [Campylobacter sp. RM13119]